MSSFAFVVRKTICGKPDVGSIVDGADFPELERLVRLGALEPMPGVELPKKEATPDDLREEITALHEKVIATQDEVDKAKSETEAVKAQCAEKLKVAQAEHDACYAELSTLEKSLNAEKLARADVERELAATNQKLATAELQLAEAMKPAVQGVQAATIVPPATPPAPPVPPAAVDAPPAPPAAPSANGKAKKTVTSA